MWAGRGVVRIWLIRHGQSLGNVDKMAYRTTPDFAMPLSGLGHEQAGRAGGFLRGLLAAERDEFWTRGGGWSHHPRMWVSPYTRARQTADTIEKVLNEDRLLKDRREHTLLSEQQFGLLDTIAGDNVADHYPDTDARYKLHKAHGGKFWAKNPSGESRFDVCQRVHQAFGTFHRDAERHGIQDLIVVAHGTTIRAFVMMWLHLPYEWFEAEPNPKNCSIRLIESGEDRGYIYPGG